MISSAFIESAKILRAILLRVFAYSALSISACSEGGESNSGTVRYFLDREATATRTNQLKIEVEGNFSPRFSLSGSGFQAAVPLDTILDLRDSTELTADAFGALDINITLYQENNQAYLSDTLHWKSSPEVPPEPAPSFSENASSDAWVFMVLPKSRGTNVKEIWIEGDLDSSVAGGQYYPIPGDDQVLIRLSEGDGVKNLKVHYRNIFGTKSSTVEASILRKEQGPKDCRVIPLAKTTATGWLRVRIQATNPGPLYYKVAGDVARSMDYKKFTDSIDEVINLSAGLGIKHLLFKIKDDANNFCDDIALQISYDPNYVSGSVAIRGSHLWTDNSLVNIDTHYDHLEGDNISMFIKGDVQPAPHTFQWIPLQAGLSVTLNPFSGNRHITVVYRKDSTDMAEVSVPIFLRPYLIIQGSSPTYELIPSDIHGLVHMSVAGCQETYQQISFQSPLPCTPSAGSSSATITYVLKDGTSLIRSANF